MNAEQAKKYLSERIWKKFLTWTQGQTFDTKDGEIEYYDYDIGKFADCYLEDKPTYFD